MSYRLFESAQEYTKSCRLLECYFMLITVSALSECDLALSRLYPAGVVVLGSKQDGACGLGKCYK